MSETARVTGSRRSAPPTAPTPPHSGTRPAESFPQQSAANASYNLGQPFDAEDAHGRSFQLATAKPGGQFQAENQDWHYGPRGKYRQSIFRGSPGIVKQPPSDY